MLVRSIANTFGVCNERNLLEPWAAQLYPSFIWPSYFEYSLWKLSVVNRLWCCASLRCIKHPIVMTVCQVMAESGHSCHLDLDKSLVLLVCYQAVVFEMFGEDGFDGCWWKYLLRDEQRKMSKHLLMKQSHILLS